MASSVSCSPWYELALLRRHTRTVPASPTIITAATNVPAIVEPYWLDTTLAPTTVASLADAAILHVTETASVKQHCNAL